MLSRRNTLLFVARIVVGISIIAAILYLVDLHEVLTTLRNVSVLALCWALFFKALGISFHAWRWSILLRSRNVLIGILETYRLILVGHFLNLFLPSDLSSDVYRIYGTKNHCSSLLQASGLIALERYFGVFATFLLALMAIALSDFATIQPMLSAILGVLFLGMIALPLMVAGTYGHRRLSNILTCLRLGRAVELIDMTSPALYSIVRDRSLVFGLVLLSMAMKVCVAIQIYFLAVGMGIDISIAHFIIFLPLYTIVNALPISISGLGVREANIIVFFTQMGIAREYAAGLAFLVAIWLYVTALPFGLFLLFGANKQETSKREPEGLV